MEIGGRLRQPVAAIVGRDLLESDVLESNVAQSRSPIDLRVVAREPVVVECARASLARSDEEPNRHTDRDPEDVGRRGLVLNAAAEVNDVEVVELVEHRCAETVVLGRIEIGAIRDERDDAVVGEPIGSPAQEALVHVVLVSLGGCAPFHVRLADAPVNLGVFAVGIEVVPVGLTVVVRRIADDHADRRLILLLDADPVFRRQTAQVHSRLPLHGAAAVALPVDIVQGVDEAEGRKRLIAADALLERVFDVQIRDVVGQDGDLVGVDLVPVLVLDAVGREMLDQAGDECSRACCRIEDLHIVVAQVTPEVIGQ